MTRQYWKQNNTHLRRKGFGKFMRKKEFLKVWLEHQGLLFWQKDLEVYSEMMKDSGTIPLEPVRTAKLTKLDRKGRRTFKSKRKRYRNRFRKQYVRKLRGRTFLGLSKRKRNVAIRKFQVRTLLKKELHLDL